MAQLSSANRSSPRTPTHCTYQFCLRRQQTPALVGLSHVCRTLLTPSIDPFALQTGYKLATTRFRTILSRQYDVIFHTNRLTSPIHGILATATRTCLLLRRGLQTLNIPFCVSAFLRCDAKSSTTALLQCDVPHHSTR